MPRTSAPYEAPPGLQWCPRHNNGHGDFVHKSAFPEGYGYCRACKRAYQRRWDKLNRKPTDRKIEPKARLSANQRKIIIHVPNTPTWRKRIGELLNEDVPDSS